jgi:LPXTG-motif cell wall-anchored protein
VPILPKTGSSAPAASIALGLLLVALGALLLGIADRRSTT